MGEALHFALLGSPVGHSLSAVMFRAAFAALDLPHRYDLVEVPDRDALERELGALRSGARHGANITMPHKRAALELADAAAPSASATGAANVLVRSADTTLIAHNTDVRALADRIAAGATGVRLRSALVIGAGGAALAALAALRLLGAERSFVSSRSLTAGANDPRRDSLERAGATVLPWGDLARTAPADVDVVVQATSAGVPGGEPQTPALVCAVPWAALSRTAFAIDLVYGPSETPFTERARREGLTAEGGLAMLVAQAEASFELWLARAAPAGVMWAAAESELALRRLG